MESFLGVDIGSSHTKIVEIMLDNGKYFLNKFALFPSQTLLQDFSTPNATNPKKSIDYFKSIIADAGFTATRAYVALPEHRILTKVIELPNIEGSKNIKQAVEFEAAEHLPVNLNDMTIKFTVLSKNFTSNNPKSDTARISLARNDSGDDTGKKLEVLLVAAPTPLIENFVTTFNKMGLEIVAMEPTSIAIARIVIAGSDVPTILMEFGHEYVDFVLVAGGSVRFVRTVKLGVYTFIRTLSQEMGMSQSQSGNYLFTYGLNPTLLDGKIKQVIEPAMDIFTQELERFIKYIESRIIFTDDTDSNKVKRLVLAGGGALIPNFIIYLIEKIGLEIDYADSWKNVDISKVEEKEMLKILGPLFTTAVGSVLK